MCFFAKIGRGGTALFALIGACSDPSGPGPDVSASDSAVPVDVSVDVTAPPADQGTDATVPPLPVDAAVSDAGGLGDATSTLDTSVAACIGMTAPTMREVSATLEVGGRMRTYHVHLPPSYDAASAAPLVFNFHGWMQSADAHRSQSRLNETADREGFITVHAEGVDTSWNAGSNCCGTAQAQNIDDVAFFDAMLAAIQRDYCIDPRRVYATGMSNGGFFSHRLACERANVIAAVASVAGLLGLETCQPSRPIPVLQFHGTSDFVVGYTTSFTGLAGAPMTSERWRSMNSCEASASVPFEMGDVRCERWSCAAGSEVELCTVMEGGHTWPGGMPTPLFGKTTTAVSASDYLWGFFERHPLP